MSVHPVVLFVSPFNHSKRPIFSCISLRIAVVDPDAVPPGALVPGPASSSGPRYTGTRTIPSYSSSGLGQPRTTEFAPSAERRPASVGTAAISVVLVVGAAIGSLIGAKVAISSGGSSGGGSSAAGASATAGSVLSQCATAVDPVSLLLHFQFLSQSGFLSLAYPANYLGFTFNFAWANFVIPMSVFKKAAVRMADLARCWSVGSGTAGGFDGVADRYGVPRESLGGIVYLSVISGMAIALAFVVLVAVILFVLESMTKGSRSHETIARLRHRWPSIASNLVLRLVSHPHRYGMLCSG